LAESPELPKSPEWKRQKVINWKGGIMGIVAIMAIVAMTPEA
jgi:hypothetical protein